jgi:hypothetical protein
MATVAHHPDTPRRFAPFHPWDRFAFPAFLAAIWFGILIGFVPDILHKAQTQYRYLWIVHLHAAAFVGWLVLLTVQVALIRTGRRALHRRLGMIGVPLAIVMPLLGAVTAFLVDQSKMGTKQADPAFLAIQFGDMLLFAALVIPALLARQAPAAHKRLIILATLALTDAGYARWLYEPVHVALGTSFWTNYLGDFAATDLLALALGGYDLATRGRLHPAYPPALALFVGAHMLIEYLYISPGWVALCTHWLTA